MHLNETAIALIINATNKITFNKPQRQNAQINAPSVPNEERIFFICLYSTIFIVGVTGNTAVCWVIGKF